MEFLIRRTFFSILLKRNPLRVREHAQVAAQMAVQPPAPHEQGNKIIRKNAKKLGKIWKNAEFEKEARVLFLQEAVQLSAKPLWIFAPTETRTEEITGLCPENRKPCLSLLLRPWEGLWTESAAVQPNAPTGQSSGLARLRRAAENRHRQSLVKSFC